MAKQPKNVSVSTREGQVTASGGEMSNFFMRQIPSWNNPSWLDAARWREFVRKQPIAIVCRDTLTAYLQSLDWAIVARDSDDQDELREDIKYYTRLLDRSNAYYTEFDFSSHIEWVVKDLFDLPFGSASEIGREYDDPDGKVVWIRPLDGGTLAPTLNLEYPVVQSYAYVNPVYLEKSKVSRVYLSPRTEIRREGWGMAPPERIYLAIELLNRGDNYYAQLISNTPEAGILDLIDVDKGTAEEWVKSARDLLFGISPMKIPVLYEHTSKAEWIPFGKTPSEILYDKVTMRYATLVCSAYGMSPSDVGFASSSNGGETLSGTIRQERRTGRSGISLAKKKLKAYFDKILPEVLEFKWIDYDDERNVAQSRARMANANAFMQLIDKQIFTPDELRRQAIADGIITISVPETLDRSKVDWGTSANSENSESRTTLGKAIGEPKSPSSGGQGDLIPTQILQKSRGNIEVGISKATFQGNLVLGAMINRAKKLDNLKDFDDRVDSYIVKGNEIRWSELDTVSGSIGAHLYSQKWVDEICSSLTEKLQADMKQKALLLASDHLSKVREEEFIEGSIDTLDVSKDEIDAYLSKYYVDSAKVFQRVKSSTVQSLSSLIVLVSKREILDYKFDIDVTDKQDNNSIKLARAVSAKVFEMLPKLLSEVYAANQQKIGYLEE